MPIIGEVRLFAMAPPAKWLTCDGSALPRTRYSALFAAIGTTWGTGDGSTTFNLPDLRSRIPIGTGQGAGLSNYNLADTGGVEGVTLTDQQSGQPAGNPSVTINDGGHSHTVGGVSGALADTSVGISDPGHSHDGSTLSAALASNDLTITDPGHVHDGSTLSASLSPPDVTINDAGHTHSITDPGHAHTIPIGAGTLESAAGSDEVGPDLNPTSTGNSTTGIVGTDSAATGVTASLSGGSVSISGSTASAATGITGAVTSGTVNVSGSTASATTGIAAAVNNATVNISGATDSATTGITATASISAADASEAHENRQPYVAVNFAIYAGR